jgi:hypothetical protein
MSFSKQIRYSYCDYISHDKNAQVLISQLSNLAAGIVARTRGKSNKI